VASATGQMRQIEELKEQAKVWADASGMTVGSMVSEIGAGATKLVQVDGHFQPQIIGDASPTGRNAMHFNGPQHFEDITLTPVDRTLHFFWVLKAQESPNRYHNLVDSQLDTGMCMWLNPQNMYEMNNCAGGIDSEYDTLTSELPAGSGWQVVQASVLGGVQSMTRISTPDHGNGVHTQGIGWGGHYFDNVPMVYSILNRHGRDSFKGLLGELIVFEGDLSQDEQLSMFEHLESKWINGYTDIANFAGDDQQHCCDPDDSEIQLDLFNDGLSGGMATTSECQQACSDHPLCQYFQTSTESAAAHNTQGWCVGYPRCPKYCAHHSDSNKAQSIFKVMTWAPTAAPTTSPTNIPTDAPTASPTVNDVAWIWDHPLCTRTWCHVDIQDNGHTRTSIKGNGEKENFHCEAYDARDHVLDAQGYAEWNNQPLPYARAQRNGCACVCPSTESYARYQQSIAYHPEIFQCSITHKSCSKDGAESALSPFKDSSNTHYEITCLDGVSKTVSHC